MKRNKRIVILLLVFVGLFAGAYSLHWSARSRLAVTGFETEKALAHNQHKLLKGKAEVIGYPFSFTVVITDFAYDAPGELRGAAQEVRIENPIWAPTLTRLTGINAYVHLVRRDIRTAAALVKATLHHPLFAPKTGKQ